MNMRNLLDLLREEKTKMLYHVTTSDIAKVISNQGFNPQSTIDYKYYSEFGKDGIYFYDNMRQSQMYAYFLKSKKPNEQLSIISIQAPESIVILPNKYEDGFFIPKDKLNQIKVISIKPINKIADMY